jgi:hypothetical protein
MKRSLALVVLLLLASTALVQAQSYTWNFQGLFPPAGVTAGDTAFVGDIHGLAVDPDGKVWVQRYGVKPGDSITVTNYMLDVDTTSVDSLETRKVGVRALHVYNPDGSEVSFSPIYFVNYGSGTDTLGGTSVYVKGIKVWYPSLSVNTGRGLRMDHDGNILATYFGYLYRINYKTGEGMAKGVLDAAASCIAVGVSDDGYVYSNRVVAGGQPLKIYNPDLTYLSNAVDTLAGFSRAIDVSHDGQDIYYAGYTNHAVIKYHSSLGVLGSYLEQVDTVMKGFDCESFCWHPTNGYLYASSGSGNDLPNQWPGLTTNYDLASWYAYDPATNTVLPEHIKWVYAVQDSDANQRPRAIAFSPGGDTAYVGVFGNNSVPGLRMYTRALTSVEPITNTVPQQVTLSQNYPNPFNPSTEIEFTVVKSGVTTLKVYDMLGKEVVTLVNESLNPGTFRTRLDGARLSSGTYFYTLTTGQTRITKKMLLMK